MALTDRLKAEGRAIRAAVDATMTRVSDNPTAVNEATTLLRQWQPGAYVIGDVRQRNGIPYRCVQEHDSTIDQRRAPGEAISLWMEYHGTSPESARAYNPVTGAHDVYQAGEYAIFEGALYRCKTDATAYSPTELPQNWERVGTTGSVGEESQTPDEPSAGEQEDEWPEWVKPSGAHDTYPLGAKITYKGKRYSSNIANNGWSPDEYAQGWTLIG